MDSTRNIIFITCLLSGICYSNAAGGADFFKDPSGTLIPNPSDNQILRKIAENLMCGDQQGWVSHFWKDTRALCAKCTLTNPCGDNKNCPCVVNADLTDFTCEARNGFTYENGKCNPPKSAVICKGGSRRVAADTLIVGKLEKYAWASGTYVRKAGLGYHNQDPEIFNRMAIPGAAVPTGKYFHDVPLKGREFYEQFEWDCTAMKFTNKVVATLSYNYDENYWQFIDTRTTGTPPAVVPHADLDRKMTLTSRSSCSTCAKICVEDVKSWSYTYKYNIPASAGPPPVPKITHYNAARLLVEPVTSPAKFQIRDAEALTAPELKAIKDAVYDPSNNFKCP